MIPESHLNRLPEAVSVPPARQPDLRRWLGGRRHAATRHGQPSGRLLRGAGREMVPATNGNADRVPPIGGRSWAHPAMPGHDANVADDHVVQFYEAEAFLLDTVAAFIGDALRHDDAGIAIGTRAQLDGLDERLAAAGLDVVTARERGQYQTFDASETLATFMVDGMPDPARFQRNVSQIIARATAGRRRARVFGSMVAVLAADGNYAAAIELERLWNELQTRMPFSLFCGYPMDQFAGEALSGFFAQVKAAHTRVLPTERYLSLPTANDRLHAIATLQQQAQLLEAEIAQRKLGEERLRVALAAERAARQETEAALRARDEFLSIAAHELRTPITGLAGHSQLLLRQIKRTGQLDHERVMHGLEVINSQASKLARLLNQLLDISRLEAGKLTLTRQRTDLTQLTEQAVRAAQAIADGRCSFRLSAPETLEADVDPLRIEQVLSNLLDNAAKYSPAGGVVDVALEQPGGQHLRLSVRDRGQGVPPEQRAQIFERFYQGEDSGNTSGLGLGLYISRQIVELHGGEIHAEFPPDGGARFVVRLPLEMGQAPMMPARAAD